uniref:G domain-containing protein n=1 Tax=Panagrolaimus sp. JU765 TaxID=591449 RepID=A0AC34Q2Z4_9BILA
MDDQHLPESENYKTALDNEFAIILIDERNKNIILTETTTTVVEAEPAVHVAQPNDADVTKTATAVEAEPAVHDAQPLDADVTKTTTVFPAEPVVHDAQPNDADVTKTTTVIEAEPAVHDAQPLDADATKTATAVEAEPAVHDAQPLDATVTKTATVFPAEPVVHDAQPSDAEYVTKTVTVFPAEPVVHDAQPSGADDVAKTATVVEAEPAVHDAQPFYADVTNTATVFPAELAVHVAQVDDPENKLAVTAVTPDQPNFHVSQLIGAEDDSKAASVHPVKFDFCGSAKQGIKNEKTTKASESHSHVCETQKTNDRVSPNVADLAMEKALAKCNVEKKKVKPEIKEEVNILILGHTGVGKSTWINSTVNYMKYPTLEEAQQQEDLFSIIPTCFSVTDENFEIRFIKVGTEQNENNDVENTGQSATQRPNTYVVEADDKLIRLIDTPGIGDTRGITQDRKNLDMILRHISHFNGLHGICILLKPNETRLDIMFQFCIKELLTHLHKSASKNIVFCFTNARSTLYKPGDTMPILKKLLDDMQSGIQINKNTVYCMDNEAFRFLCTLHNGIQYDNDDQKNYSASWDKSVAETKRLFNYVAMQNPHPIRDTMSLNAARNIIINLTRPLADISKNIEMNIAVIEEKEKEIENSKQNIDQLAKKLYVPQITLESTPLDYPITVCTHTDCVVYLPIGTISQTQPYNDSLNDYLEYLINEEKNKVNKTEADRKTLNGLIKMQAAYQEEVKIIEHAMRTEITLVITPEDIKLLEQELYNLPLSGKELKQNMDVEVETQTRMMYSATCYVKPKLLEIGFKNDCICNWLKHRKN